MDNNKKMLLIGGGVVAVGAIFLIARSAKAQAQPQPTPVTPKLPPNPNPNGPNTPIAYTPPTSTTNAPITGSVVTYGANGMTPAQIRCVQTALTNAGYDTKGIDGSWGKNTAQALANYQAANGLPASGTFDGNTANSPLGACLKGGTLGSQMTTPGGGGGGTTLQSDAVATQASQQTQAAPDPTQVPVGATQFSVTGFGTVYSGCNSDGDIIDPNYRQQVFTWINGQNGSLTLQLAANDLQLNGCTTAANAARAAYANANTDS